MMCTAPISMHTRAVTAAREYNYDNLDCICLSWVYYQACVQELLYISRRYTESPKKRKRTTKRGVSHKNAPTSSSPPLKQRRVAREMAEREITSSRESVHSSGYSDGAPLSVSSRHSIDQDSRLRERLIAMAAFPTGEPTSGTPAENENGHRSSLRNKRRRRRRRMDEEEGERMEERGIDGERVVEVREREGEGLTDRGEAEGETEDHNTSEQGPDAEGEQFNLLCVYPSIYTIIHAHVHFLAYLHVLSYYIYFCRYFTAWDETFTRCTYFVVTFAS